MSDRKRAILLLVVTVTLWSTSGVLIKLIDWNVMAIAGARGAFAGLALWLALRRPHFDWSGAQIGGALAYVGTQTFFIAAVQMTTAANAIFLQYTAPVFVAFFGIWFLRERPRPVDWLSMAAIGGGLLLFLQEDLSATGALGNLFALLSGVSLAWMVLFMRKQKDGSPAETALLGNIFSTLLGLPFMVGPLAVGPPPTGQEWLILLFLGVCQIGLPFLLYARAIKHLTAIETVLIQTLEPILNPIWVFLVIGETPSTIALSGGLVVLGAVVMRAAVAAGQGRRPPARARAAAD